MEQTSTIKHTSASSLQEVFPATPLLVRCCTSTSAVEPIRVTLERTTPLLPTLMLIGVAENAEQEPVAPAAVIPAKHTLLLDGDILLCARHTNRQNISIDSRCVGRLR